MQSWRSSNTERKNRKALDKLSDQHMKKWSADILIVLKSILLEHFDQQNTIFRYGILFFQSSGHSIIKIEKWPYKKKNAKLSCLQNVSVPAELN